MVRFNILIVLILVGFSCLSQNSKVVYRYKKYEKFNLDSLVIKRGNVVDSIDITARYRKTFKNKLPQRLNFNLELIRGVQTIK